MVPISSSQDTPGPMTQTVAQSALLLDVLTDKREYAKSINEDYSIRIGFVNGWITQDAGTNQLLSDLIGALGRANISVGEISLPEPSEQDGQDEFKVLMHELNEDLATYLAGRAGEGVRNLQDVVNFNLSNKDVEMQYFAQEYFDLALELCGRNASYQNLRAGNLDWAMNKVLNPGFEKFDILIGATYSPSWISNLGGGDDFSSASWISMAPAIAGTPIGCLPMGLVDGLPVGVGLVSRANQEGLLVNAMAKIEKVLGLGILRPTFTVS
jgi:amidase